MSNHRKTFTIRLFGFSLFAVEWENATTQNEAPATRVTWRRLKHIVARRDSHVCRYCGELTQDGHLDHIIPISKGGTDHLDNLAWSCRGCNLKKGSSLLLPDTSEDSSHQAQNIIPNGDKSEQVKRGLLMGKTKTAIINEVWGVSGGKAYNQASSC